VINFLLESASRSKRHKFSLYLRNWLDKQTTQRTTKLKKCSTKFKDGNREKAAKEKEKKREETEELAAGLLFILGQ
jgi:C4-dicarboxylate-specific signal transduction histidine kinase